MKHKVVERNSSIELLRILCMLAIVCGHIIICHHTVYSLSNPEEILRLFVISFIMVHVNTFALISGYFGIRFNLKRLVSLDLQTIFYSVALFFVAVFLGWKCFSFRGTLVNFFPILTEQYWFVSCYAVVYLISPLLNRWAESMSMKEFQHILIGGFFIIYLWPSLSFLINTPQFINDSGHGIVNMTFLYLLGRYLKMHFVDIRKSARYYGGGYILCSLCLFLFSLIISWIGGFEFTSLHSYNTLFILIGSVLLFLTFLQLKFKSRIVNWLAKPCLAAYLFHMNMNTWFDFCDWLGVRDIHGWNYIALLIVLPIVIYLISVCIEYLRMWAMMPLENFLSSVIERHLKLSKE